MDDPESTQARAAASLYLPLVLLCVGVLLSLIWQIAALQAQRSEFKARKEQLATLLQNREPQVAQAAEIQRRLEALANDLLQLSKTNPNAAAIVKKYDIQQNLDAAAAAAASAGK